MQEIEIKAWFFIFLMSLELLIQRDEIYLQKSRNVILIPLDYNQE